MKQGLGNAKSEYDQNLGLRLRSIVLKFGGSSLSCAERIENCIQIIQSEILHNPLVVVSAMGDMTDDLFALAQKSLQGQAFGADLKVFKNILDRACAELKIQNVYLADFQELEALLKSNPSNGNADIENNKSFLDSILSFGERMTAKIVAAGLIARGIAAQAYNAWDLGFVTDANFGQAKLKLEKFPEIAASVQKILESGILPVITGFIAKSEDGRITTLGRGGSDLSATILASVVDAQEIHFWKDVDGIMNCNPKSNSHAVVIPLMTYEEASQLADAGACVLQKGCLIPVQQSKIPIRVRNSFHRDRPGTWIVSERVKSKLSLAIESTL